MFKDFGEAVDAMVKTGQEFQPDSNNSQIYEALYQEVYMKTYRALAPLYKRGSEITGYKEN
jgi:sugar (pentulose or hexulose) kinase